jgi:hypothetical protein
MNPGASLFHWPSHQRHGDHGTAWALTVAILFAAVAAVSFAIDQSVTLSNLPAPQPNVGSR